MLARHLVLVAVLAAAPVVGQDVADVLRARCATCHGGDDPEAGLDVLALVAAPPGGSGPGAATLDWLPDVRDALRAHEMPPPDEPQPTAAERALLVAWAERTLALAAGREPPDPGRVTMRRLSRHEYRNTVRDLLGVVVDVDEFPADDLAYGFDSVGDALSLSTLHVEKYAAAAARVVAEALPDPDPVPPPVLVFDATALESSLDRAARGDVVSLYSNGTASCRVRVPRAGRYRVRVLAFATQAGDELARMAVQVDRRTVEHFDVTGTRDEVGTYTVDVDLPGRDARVAAAFVNDYYRPDHPDPAQRDRNLLVTRIEVEGPLDERTPTAAERWLAPLDPGTGRPETRARPLLRALMERAWRRPVTRAEVARIARIVRDATRDGEPYHEALRWGAQAVLVSPNFLFRVEPGGDGGALAGDLVATRLSYFLWSTLPDDELRAAAARLDDLDVLRAQARRLLDDPRSVALAENFAGQWLELRRLSEIAPDPDRFPSWDAGLAASARRESELLFEAVLRERLPATALVDAPFTFVDARLAAHYGLAAPDGDGFVRVALDGGRPGGVLGHASVLALTSNPTRTSPVKRGKWILDNLLDDPPPPPPPGFDSFAGESEIDSAASLREQMAQHRAKPACAICHVRMDALGLALEGFDAVGRARSTDAGGAIDVRAELPGGRVLDGAADLQRLVAADPAFRRALLRKLFVYAIGRGVRPADALVLDARAHALPADVPLADLVLEIVQLDAFRRRSNGS